MQTNRASHTLALVKAKLASPQTSIKKKHHYEVIAVHHNFNPIQLGCKMIVIIAVWHE